MQPEHLLCATACWVLCGEGLSELIVGASVSPAGPCSQGGGTSVSPRFSSLLVFELLADLTGTVTKLPDRRNPRKDMLTDGIGIVELTEIKHTEAGKTKCIDRCRCPRCGRDLEPGTPLSCGCPARSHRSCVCRCCSLRQGSELPTVLGSDHVLVVILGACTGWGDSKHIWSVRRGREGSQSLSPRSTWASWLTDRQPWG